MKTYDITQESEIVLYGLNVYTEKQIEVLTKEGFVCRAIIDRRADALKECQGIRIVSDVTKLKNLENICVFVMLQNALVHMEIAEMLYHQGVDKVLFIPMKKGFYDKNVQNNLIVRYNMMLQQQYDGLRNIPYLSNAFFQQRIEPFCSIAMELQGSVVAWVPVEKLFTTWVEPGGYHNIPIAAFQPYRHLFDFLAGKQADISEYISLFGISALTGDDKKRDILKKRKELFDYFEYEINRGFEYFIVSAPEAKWNEEGYFNLCEGQHRCVYLLNKGFRRIPVRIDNKTLTMLNTMYSQYCWSNELFQYMIAVQKFFGKEQLCDRTIMCSKGFPETIKQNLQCCKAVLSDKLQEAEVYFDYDTLITDCFTGIEHNIMQLANMQCKMIICLDYQNSVMNTLQKKEKNYGKRVLCKLLVDYKEMELCVFERKEISKKG